MKLKDYIIENYSGNVSEFARLNEMSRGAVLHMIRSGRYVVREKELIKIIRNV